MSIVELLIAALVTSVVSAGVLGAVRDGQRAFVAQSEAADVRQRLRFGIETLSRELLMATAVVPSPDRITIVQGPARRTYYRDATTSQLRYDDGQGTDLPVLDQVTDLAFEEERPGGVRVRGRIAIGGIGADFTVAPRNMNVWP